nr:MAG: polymerase PB1 [Xinjiang sediment orthomyxo-like virus 4]
MLSQPVDFEACFGDSAENRFSDIPNSFYDEVFKRKRRSDIAIPNTPSLGNLSIISGLYQYNNPPPMANGTPAPKVIETVKRAYEYNLKEEKTINIDRYTIDNPCDTSVKRNEAVSSNFNPTIVHEATKKFLMENYQKIDEVIEETIEKFSTQNSDILTTGKQTWCPLSYASVPCPIAYNNFCKFLTLNGFGQSHSLIEIIQFCMELMNKDIIVGYKLEHYYTDSFQVKNRQMVPRKIKHKKVVEHVYKGDDCLNYVVDLIRSFCSYLKHRERAHLARRAIASPSVPFRAFLLIIETMHLELGKRINGSTISIGGEEKKAKILSLMNTSSHLAGGGVSLQATQDATKWNECLSAMAFGLFHETLTNAEVRRELGIQAPSKSVEFYGQLCKTAHFFLNIKRITLGNGPQGFSASYTGLISFTKENINKFNSEMKNKMLWAMDKITEEIYLDASAGMLMGMHNALSTTFGLIMSNFNTPPLSQILVLRSSDDSMTRYTAPDIQSVLDVIAMDKINYHLIGINLSDKKSFIFPNGFGEYTSWYQDGKMASQYGVEATTMRPSGTNPPDDFFNIAKGTAIAQQKIETNMIGAGVRIRIGIDNVRSLYNIKKRERNSLSLGVTVLSDGGLNPWDPFNCHLEETCLKEKFVKTDFDKDYLMKIRDPSNPFAGAMEETVNWDPKSGGLSFNEVETPRTVFHYVKRANRSITNIQGKTNANTEKHHAAALRIINESDVSTNIIVPSSRVPAADHVKNCLLALAVDIDMDQGEQITFFRAIERLSGIVDNEDMEQTSDQDEMEIE